MHFLWFKLRLLSRSTSRNSTLSDFDESLTPTDCLLLLTSRFLLKFWFFVFCLAAFFHRGVGKAKLVLTCRCVYVFVSFLRYRTGTWTWLLVESKVNEAMRWNVDFRLVTRSLQSVTGDAVHAKAGNHLRTLARSTETLQRKWSVQLWKHLISSPFRAVLIRDKRKRF